MYLLLLNVVLFGLLFSEHRDTMTIACSCLFGTTSSYYSPDLVERPLVKVLKEMTTTIHHRLLRLLPTNLSSLASFQLTLSLQ